MGDTSAASRGLSKGKQAASRTSPLGASVPWCGLGRKGAGRLTQDNSRQAAELSLKQEVAGAPGGAQSLDVCLLLRS